MRQNYRNQKVDANTVSGLPTLRHAPSPRAGVSAAVTSDKVVVSKGPSGAVVVPANVASVADLSGRTVQPLDEGSTRVRYDRPGHLEDAHAERLLRLSHRHGPRDEFVMLFEAADGDDLATELGEQAVTSMLGGGETWLDTVNAEVDEEDGGPFLETRSAREFAPGSDEESEGFLREALPTSSARSPSSTPPARRRR